MLAEPYPLQSQRGAFTAHISASVGVAVWHEGIDSDESLIQAADRAMYQAKENGKNGCVLSSF